MFRASLLLHQDLGSLFASSFNLRSYWKIEENSTAPRLTRSSELHLIWANGKIFFVFFSEAVQKKQIAVCSDFSMNKIVALQDALFTLTAEEVVHSSVILLSLTSASSLRCPDFPSVHQESCTRH